MNKNVKLLYCMLGSAILALTNNPIFVERTINTIFYSGMENHVYPRNFLVWLTQRLSLIGFILLIVFSITLIVRNISVKDKA